MTDQEDSLIIAQTSDEWGPMYIADVGNERSLHFSSDSPQSSMWLDAPFDLTIEYTQLLMASLLFIPQPKSALLFGLGGGSIAKFLWKTFPACDIHAVELRPQLVEWAHDHFALPRSPRIHIHTQDAIAFASQKPLELFDLIIIDLFTAEGMSGKLSGHSFFALCERFLSPKGVVGWNVWQSAPKELLEASISEMCYAFGNNIVALPSKTEGNLTLIALPEPLETYKLSRLKTKAQNLSDKTHLNFPFLMRAYNNFKNTQF
jgi:spermidine synthase